MGRILAIDIGEKRIGFAITDPMKIIVQPLSTEEWKGIEHLIDKLEIMIADLEIEEIIIGIPYTLKGGLSQKTKEILEIKSELEQKLKITIKEQDERFTSKMAKMSLITMGKSPSKSKDKVDQLAAVFILQSYINRSKNN